MTNIFQDKLDLVAKYAQESSINSYTLMRLSSSEQFLEVTLPLKREDNTLNIIKAYRCRYSSLLGPAKGGIRFHPAADRDIVNVLGLGMTLKNSLVGLPYGGSKGAVVIDPTVLSKNELEKISRLYVRAIAKEIGPMLDVPAPDVNTNATIMGWMIDEYENYVGHKDPAVITGKPIESGGSYFRGESTGYGVYLMAKLLTQKLKKDPQNMRVAIQGFGNLGSSLAYYLHQEGFKVVAISDVKGGIYNANGLDINTLMNNFKDSSKKDKSIADKEISGFIADLKSINNEELLSLDVDILLPAAMDGVLTEANANQVKAPYIIEGANSPTTKGALAILEKNGKLILPDILCNSGGVIVSYFEWVQNLQSYYWTQQEVKDKLTLMLTNAFEKVWEVSEKYNKSPVSAAYHVSLERLESAIKAKYNLI